MRKIELFDYQADMRDRIERALASHRSVMAQMPTGTGKTYLLTAVVCAFLKANPGARVWIVAHRRELVSQIEDAIGRFCLSVKDGGDGHASIEAMSIQWLMRHYGEMADEPGLVVIDEAHHALAKTYKEMWRRYPGAKFLGLTATPCRLNGRGFTDMFDVLVQSWSIPRFIQEGRLAAYDFVSIKADGVTQKLIDSLKKRGADGDYQNKEMDMVLNKRPSIERLFKSMVEYGRDRKGIVYAINISHARCIADYYREHGVNAVAIDSHTPADERKELIDRFRMSDAGDADSADAVKVLVNVDIFSEGFDCPDVEFVQLARPTLSLAKYLQMVGRGLRVGKGKKSCVVIDNVGLYRVFGLPSQVWDWNAMFEGRMSKRDVAETVATSVADAVPVYVERGGNVGCGADAEMVIVVSHEQLAETFKQCDEDEALAMRRECVLRCDFGRVEHVGRQLVRLVAARGHGMEYVDLKNMNRLRAAADDESVPRVVTVGGVEMLRWHGRFYSRTRKVVSFACSKDCVIDKGFYSIHISDERNEACRAIADKEMLLGSNVIVFLHDDTRNCYWRCCKLADGSLVLMDEAHVCYWKEDGVPKKRIGSVGSEDENCGTRMALAGIRAEVEARLSRRRLDKEAMVERMDCVRPCQIGSKWGLRSCDGRVVVPPIYRRIREENGFYAFEKLVNHWGVMNRHGKVLVLPVYDDVEITADGKAVVRTVTGSKKMVDLE